jgi:hypothetical protein
MLFTSSAAADVSEMTGSVVVMTSILPRGT